MWLLDVQRAAACHSASAAAYAASVIRDRSSSASCPLNQFLTCTAPETLSGLTNLPADQLCLLPSPSHAKVLFVDD